MNILGIDTSFDDTAAAVVSDGAILSNVLSSELEQHQEWGGVVPRLARASHETYLPSVIARALKRAFLSIENIDAIAVTQGPGLAITLEIGIAGAKALSLKHNKPLVAVNHMEGHLLSFLASPKKENKEHAVTPSFPFMAVLISGGHTQFVLVKDIGVYEIVGETQDDAMGEAFDKVGRMLGLGYPAGSLVEKLAKDGVHGAINFPIPMLAVKSADTSFSGLKTAAMRIVESKLPLDAQKIADISLGFQTAAITHLTKKLKFALEEHPVEALVLGGGVAANLSVRQALHALAKEYGIPFLLPYTKKLCVDNAAMIALAGEYHAKRAEFVTSLDTLDRLPQMRLDSPNK